MPIDLDGKARVINGTVDIGAYEEVDAGDIDALFMQANAGTNNTDYDQTSDGLVDSADVDELVRDACGTQYGDANLDRRVDLSDLSIVETNWRSSGVGWADGDFDGDGVVTLSDLSIFATYCDFDANSEEDDTIVSSDEVDSPQAPQASRATVTDSSVTALGAEIGAVTAETADPVLVATRGDDPDVSTATEAQQP